MIEVIDCDQGSPEWFTARLGVPSASKFATIMAKGRGGGDSVTRREYLRKLAGEILTGEPMESYVSAAMERGKLMEDEARDLYSLMMDIEPIRVGFIKNGVAGCSPDSLIGDAGGLEIKSAAAHIQIERLQDGVLPPEHKAQVQGSLWITGREWWDFCSYCPKLPPLIVRVERDEAYIAEIERAVRVFAAELDQLVGQIRNYSARAAA